MLFCLSVVCIRSVFALVMLVQHVVFQSRGLRVQNPRAQGHLGDGFQGHGVLYESAAFLPHVNGAWPATRTAGMARGSRPANRSTITWPVLPS